MPVEFRKFAGSILRQSLRLAAPFKGNEIPVLTYHSIDESGSLLSIAPAALRRQLAALRDENWRSLSISEYLARVNGGVREPRTLLITFDDGYRNFAEHGLPLLKEFGFTATLFVPVDFIGKPPLWLQRDEALTRPLLQQVRLSPEERRRLEFSTSALMREPLMDWSELRELINAGCDIQSHGFGHYFLTELPAVRLADDLVRSRETLEERLGLPVRAIAYPYGASNSTVAAAARAAGFDVGFVSDHGPRDDLRMMSWRGGVSGRLPQSELIAILRTWPLYPRLRQLVRHVGAVRTVT